MGEERDIQEYIRSLLNSDRLGDQVAYHGEMPASPATHSPNARPWPKAVSGVLQQSGIEELYTHQALSTDLIRSGQHTVVSTPTASGKTYIYNLPVIESVLQNPESRALYLFPLKALAQDQLGTFTALTRHWPEEARPTAAIYDGDTTAWFRKKIRNNPPNVVMTNPEMLHLSLLPYHDKWAVFLSGLTHVVVDEVHTYRGVMGSHMAQVFRRLRRVCALYGVNPTFVFCSATIGNPKELAGQLTGLEVKSVLQSGAPQGKRHFVFLNPTAQSPSQTAILLLQSALHRGLRTIVYSQSRKMTELISLWASQRAGKFAGRISAYRAGYLAEERREIEARMNQGELLAVISTSALELGIDIGDLDLCILVGYPGTIMSTLQRGGRVGRGLQESAVALIAREDALDQYFMRNPKDFFDRDPESAVVNPGNEIILAKHLECAAAELPLASGEEWLEQEQVRKVLGELQNTGKILQDAEGREYYAARKRPHRDVDLRGAGSQYQIETAEDGRIVGQMDEHRAFKETHEGAVYLHLGKPYVVEKLDIASRTVRVQQAKVAYYTRVRAHKMTEILSVQAEKNVYGTTAFLGRVKVTETITGYEKRSVRGGKILAIVPLDLPPLTFETESIWFEVPLWAKDRAEENYLHFMGGIHALEHAMIGILPLLIMTDRNDLGGISIPMHPQVGAPAVFVYDGIPGGVGLSTQAFGLMEELFQRTWDAIDSCECELGCPSCVHSPKCGSGNRPLDKQAALYLLRNMMDAEPQASNTERNTMRDRQEKDTKEATAGGGLAQEEQEKNVRYGVLDVETQKSAQEVGGWGNIRKMKFSVCVVYDSESDTYTAYEENQADALFKHLLQLNLIIGFNIKRFDYTVLAPYTDINLKVLPTLDILEEIYNRLNYRLSLDHMAKHTLGTKKSGDGLQALEWWKQGAMDKIIEYCTKDVAITRDLYLHGKEHGYLLFQNKAKKKVRLPVEW